MFASFLDGLPDGGVVMCHPGFVDAELARLDHLTAMREEEYAFFAGERFHNCSMNVDLPSRERRAAFIGLLRHPRMICGHWIYPVGILF